MRATSLAASSDLGASHNNASPSNRVEIDIANHRAIQAANMPSGEMNSSKSSFSVLPPTAPGTVMTGSLSP